MSLIRGKWTKQEIKVHNYLKGHKVRHVMHPGVEGSPDIILKDHKVAIFLHGCFWHGCSKHYKKPVSNAEFWAKKIGDTRKRDRAALHILKRLGWEVVVLWEHDIPTKGPLDPRLMP